MISVSIKGVDRLLKQLNRAREKSMTRTFANLVRAGLFIQGEAMRRIPVDTGNLRASAFTVWSSDMRVPALPEMGILASTDKLDDPATHDSSVALHQAEADMTLASTGGQVIVGFTAYYAVYVHENLQAYHETGQAKFLQAAIADNMQTLKALVKA